MSSYPIESLLDPASLAVVGASSRPGSIGAVIWHNLRAGNFRGPVYAVNSRHRRLDGQSVHARAADLPQPPGLAIVCTPVPTVAGVVRELGERGTRAVIVMTAGLDAAQCAAMLDAAREHGMRLLGPGSSGVLSPHAGLNASIAHTDALPGELAFVSQSGALVSAMLDWARARSIGFSHLVSLGGHADVDAAELLDHLASDGRTRSILLYLEHVGSARRFLSAARSAARNKPVIVVRGGAAAGLPGADRVYDAAIARAGMLRVCTLQDMFLAAETLVRFRGNRSEQLCILVNGQGAATLAADAAARAGVSLATLAEATLRQLDPFLAQPARAASPLHLRAHAPPEHYPQVLEILRQDPSTAAWLLVHTPSPAVHSAAVARALLPFAQPPRLLGCWLGHAAVAEARRVFQQAGIATYTTPEEAVSALSMLIDYRRNQAQLLEAPPDTSLEIRADSGAARALVQRVLGSGRTMLDADETRTLFAAYGMRLDTAYRVEPEPYAAASAAEKAGYPASLSLVGEGGAAADEPAGDRLDLRDAVQVRDAARALLAEGRRRHPPLRAQAFVVQAAQRPAHTRELHAGARIDPLFGPVIVLGSGSGPADGSATAALPPLNLPLARALVHRAGAGDLLGPQADVHGGTALTRLLVVLSQMLIDLSPVCEIALGPLRCGGGAAVVTGAQVRLSLLASAGALNFAIRPYPSHLEEVVDWHGHRLTLRPIRPEDEAQHMAFLGAMDPADIRMRVFYTRRSIERSELARMVQIDYAREMALIAEDTGDDGQRRTLGVVRAISDPDNSSAEFGILVRSDMKGRHLGELLMRRIIDCQRSQGTPKLVATVLAENGRMLALARRLGFVEVPAGDGDGTRAIELDLKAVPD